MASFQHVSKFFTGHSFAFDTTKDIAPQFDTLSKEKGWSSSGQKEQKTAKIKELSRALIKDFKNSRGYMDEAWIPTDALGNSIPPATIPFAPRLPHITEYFASYEFLYDPSKEILKQFYSLTNQEGWSIKTTDTEEQKKAKQQLWKPARVRLSDAIAEDFNLKYGFDVDSLKPWRTLCKVIGINPVPKKLQDRRKAVSDTFVNIVDLVEGPKEGTQFISTFESLEWLEEYTRLTGRYINTGDARAGGVLQLLLQARLHIPTPRKLQDKRPEKGRKIRESGFGKSKEIKAGGPTEQGQAPARWAVRDGCDFALV